MSLPKVNIPNKNEGVFLFYVIQEWKAEAQYFFDCSWGRERITFHISMLMELAWKPVIFLLRIKVLYYNSCYIYFLIVYIFGFIFINRCLYFNSRTRKFTDLFIMLI